MPSLLKASIAMATNKLVKKTRKFKAMDQITMKSVKYDDTSFYLLVFKFTGQRIRENRYNVSVCGEDKNSLANPNLTDRM